MPRLRGRRAQGLWQRKGPVPRSQATASGSPAEERNHGARGCAGGGKPGGATLRQRGVGRSQKAQAAGGEAREDGSQLPRPQVARRLREDFAHVVHHAQVTAVLALVGARSRPGSGDAPAVDRSAEQKSGAAAPVIGTAAAVHGDGATELRDGHDEKVRSTGFEALKERSQTRPEVLGGASEAPLFGALTHV